MIMTIELKDWLNSINLNKNNIIKEDPDTERKYAPFIINKCMSGHLDTVLLANEMNMNHSLSKSLQYDFFLNSVRKKKRFSPWLRKDKIKNLDVVKQYYGYSNEKATQVLRILTSEQIAFIRSKLEIGGKR
jgi:hypothetical protein|tara:strand:- start:460 stop:852 length:393 start_codon:yes stop_codon:yes gene_type:complete